MFFLLTGVPRSGTTILMDVVNSNNKIYCVYELGLHYCRYRFCKFNHFRDKVLSNKYILEFNDSKLLSIIKRSTSYDNFLQNLCKDFHGKIIGDKYFPTDKFLINVPRDGTRTLFILRNPVYSFISNYNRKFLGWEWLVEGCSGEEISLKFYDFFKKALEFISLDAVTLIRYEKACIDKSYVTNIFKEFFGTNDFNFDLLKNPRIYSYEEYKDIPICNKLFYLGEGLGYEYTN